MIPWVLLDRAPTPLGDGELRLMQRGGEFSIMIGGNELMNSRLGGSEAALATLACERIRSSAPCVLIGGLGMGFSLRAALSELGPEARIVVAEIVAAVVAWAHGPLAPVFGDSLSDPRVEVRRADVVELIGSAEGAYDAVLLDVDNGPGGLVSQDNDRLYDAQGLAAIRRALRPGGVLAVWSCAPDEAFSRRLAKAGYAVSESRVRAYGRGRCAARGLDGDDADLERLAASLASGGIRLRVQDSGNGVADDLRDRVPGLLHHQAGRGRRWPELRPAGGARSWRRPDVGGVEVRRRGLRPRSLRPRDNRLPCRSGSPYSRA